MKKFFDNIENAICAIGLIIMTSITVINVFSRKFLGMSMSFLEEITVAMFILISLFGAAAVAREGGHLGLDLITSHLPKKIQKSANILVWVCAALFSVFMIINGFRMVRSEIELGMKTPSLGWPEWWFGIIIPISGIFILIRFTQWTVSILRNKEVE